MEDLQLRSFIVGSSIFGSLWGMLYMTDFSNPIMNRITYAPLIILFLSGGINIVAVEHILHDYHDKKSIPSQKERQIILGVFGAIMGAILVFLRRIYYIGTPISIYYDMAIIGISALMYSFLIDFLNKKMDVY